jgi:hypothetical protein
VEDGRILSDLDVESLRTRLKEAMGRAEAPPPAPESEEPGARVEETAEARAAKR